MTQIQLGDCQGETRNTVSVQYGSSDGDAQKLKLILSSTTVHTGSVTEIVKAFICKINPTVRNNQCFIAKHIVKDYKT